MAVELIFKNSGVKDQKPVPGAVGKGEIVLNSNVNSPALYLKDTSGKIQQVSGVVIGTDAPGGAPWCPLGASTRWYAAWFVA